MQQAKDFSHSLEPILCKLVTILSRRNCAIAVALFIFFSRIFPADSFSQTSFLYAVLPLAYLGTLWVAFSGMGAWIAKESAPIIQTAVGLSACAIVFAVFSVVHIFNPFSISAVFLFGTWCYAHKAKGTSASGAINKVDLALVSLFACVTAVVLVVKIYYPVFNIYDDYAAYLPFIKKLAYSGTLGGEFLSERRLISSLDAYYYINAPTLYFLPIQFARIVDTVFCGLCLSFLAFRFAGLGFGALFTVSYMFFPQPDINTLPYYLLIFLTCALTVTVFRKDFLQSEDSLRSVALMSTVAFAARSSTIPLVVFIMASAFVFHLLSNRSKVKEVVTVFAKLGVLAVPCVMLFSSLHFFQTGTFLFPVLGMGGHGSQYMNYFNPASTSLPHGAHGLIAFVRHVRDEAIHSYTFVITFAVTLVAFLYGAWKRKGDAVMMILGCAMGILIFMHSVGTETGAFIRYAQPLMLTLLGIAAICLNRFDIYPRLRAHRYMLVLAIVVGTMHLSALVDPARNFVNYNSFPDGKDAKQLQDDFSKPYLKNAYAELGRHIPNQDKTLVRVSYPFLLDLTPNTVIMDLPGGASPSPGIPLDADAESVASYLIQHQIRYVAWDYQRRSFYDDVSFRCDIYYCVPWIDSSVKYIRKTASVFDELMLSRKILYQNDGMVLMDLASKSLSRPN